MVVVFAFAYCPPRASSTTTDTVDDVNNFRFKKFSYTNVGKPMH